MSSVRSQAQPSAHYQRCLDYVRTHAAGDVAGLFGPRSIAWRVNREAIVLAAGPAAIILEVLMPGVAEGVDSYSDFRKSPIPRARRTFISAFRLTFGDLEMAINAGSALYRIHKRVGGTIRPETSRTLAGTHYRANDPELLLWVHATLVWGVLRVYQQLITRLTPDELETYYDESRVFAAVLGLHPDDMPSTYKDFVAWFDAVVAEQLECGETASALIASVMQSPVFHTRVDAWLTWGLLPESWRHVLRIRPRQRAQRNHRRAMRALSAWTELPPLVRFVPAYHQAQLRVSTATGDHAPLPARLIDVIDRRWPIPASIGTPANRRGSMLRRG